MLLREMNERAFPAIESWQWEEIARAVFNERKGRPAQGYDRRLARAFGGIDLSRPAPDLWPQFMALGQFPALVIRGGEFRFAERRNRRGDGRAPPQSAHADRAGPGTRAAAERAGNGRDDRKFLAAND